MKTINEAEYLIWLVTALSFMIVYAIMPERDTFLILAMSSVILARISKNDNKTKEDENK